MTDNDLDITTDTEALPDTRQVSMDGGEKSELTVEFADTPIKWINEIEERMGWVFTDGHTASDYVLKYLDPLELSIVPKHTFVLSSADEDSGADYTYQRARSWKAWSEEPETNEFYLVGCDETGRRIACCYLDTDSQDPDKTLTEREANWIGARRVAAMPVPGNVKRGWLENMAYRIGREASSRIDRAEFDADWPAMLWINDVVEILPPTGETVPGTGIYRISAIEVEFQGEHLTAPRRIAKYSVVKIGS